MATWEWQLSKHRLCFNKTKISYDNMTDHVEMCVRVCQKPHISSYRPTFVLLGGVMHCFVPRSSTVATDFVHIKFPIPAILVIILTTTGFTHMCGWV